MHSLTYQNQRRPLILISNDDGLQSPGLHAAMTAVHDLADLFIIAPMHQQSAMGRSLPPNSSGEVRSHELAYNGETFVGYAVDGSPAQAVQYALAGLCPRTPDLVISGINYGENLGTGTTISGTVGAALQAADMGVPALAISLETDPSYHYSHEHGQDVDWSTAVHFTRYFAQRMLHSRLPHDVDVLKVDIPREATPDTPWRVTCQSRQSYYRPKRTLEPHSLTPVGVLGIHVAIDYHNLSSEEDIHAFSVDRVVSVTPLSLDLTSRVELSTLCRQLMDATD